MFRCAVCADLHSCTCALVLLCIHRFAFWLLLANSVLRCAVETTWWGILSPPSSGSFSTYTQTKHNTSNDKKHNYKYKPYDGEYYRQSHQMAFQRSSAQLHSEVEEVMSVLMDFQPGADDYLSDRGQIFEYTMHMSIRRWCHLIHSTTTTSLLQILKSCEEGENVWSRAGFSIWILFRP